MSNAYDVIFLDSNYCEADHFYKVEANNSMEAIEMCATECKRIDEHWRYVRVVCRSGLMLTLPIGEHEYR